MTKIIRSICYFTKDPDSSTLEKLLIISKKLKANNFLVQTTRICSPGISCSDLKKRVGDLSIIVGSGTVSFHQLQTRLDDFIVTKDCSINLDLTHDEITLQHAEILFKIIQQSPSSTFHFAYTFNNSPSSAFFPSAQYEKEGFSIGLQPTDLSKGCDSLDAWLQKMKTIWEEIHDVFQHDPLFLGIDSSIASLLSGSGSLVNFVKRLGMDFDKSVLTDTYLQITRFIKSNNPKLVGLSGIMYPCLEDFELAYEYEKGNFTLERNIFLSLHSGLGIDTYPIGIDEDISKVVHILKLVQGLSNKYSKPLSVRFVSDGKAKIGDMTDYNNPYLKDVVIRKL